MGDNMQPGQEPIQQSVESDRQQVQESFSGEQLPQQPRDSVTPGSQTSEQAEQLEQTATPSVPDAPASAGLAQAEDSQQAPVPTDDRAPTEKEGHHWVPANLRKGAGAINPHLMDKATQHAPKMPNMHNIHTPNMNMNKFKDAFGGHHGQAESTDGNTQQPE